MKRPDILTADGYPTQEALDYIAVTWGMNHGKLDTPANLDFTELLEMLEEMWWGNGWGFKRTRKRLYLSTGGWSGNEDIIEVLRGTWFWQICWMQHRRGGHYVFEIKKVK